MALIKSISGIRGTIGDFSGENLTPVDIVSCTSAYGTWLKERTGKNKNTVIIGRDARISGQMVNQLVCGTLMGLGIDVIDLGLATTPTVEIAVSELRADGGIILTASHNPKQWNALKLLNSSGEFLSAEDGQRILEILDKMDFKYAKVDELGEKHNNLLMNEIHINKILKLELVNVEAIKKANFKVAIDCVNSVGGTIIPGLLDALGVKSIIKLYCEANGQFPHNPEPLPEHLTDIMNAVVENNADLGFVVDPDVDRLAIISEDGSYFGEEYTLVAVADYILQHNRGNTVSNLSSSRALKDLSTGYNVNYSASAVGEVNVVKKMKETNAVIGGEGNGGIIYPELHYGRDSLVGIALFLSYLAQSGRKCSQLKMKYPAYTISKNKIELNDKIDIDGILNSLKQKYSENEIIDIDGIKIEFEKEWVHLRKSNTEPVIRIYAESATKVEADQLAEKIISEIQGMIK